MMLASLGEHSIRHARYCPAESQTACSRACGVALESQILLRLAFPNTVCSKTVVSYLVAYPRYPASPV